MNAAGQIEKLHSAHKNMVSKDEFSKKQQINVEYNEDKKQQNVST